MAPDHALARRTRDDEAAALRRTWLERDGRRTSMCEAGGHGVQFAVPGRDGCGAGIFLMGPVRPADDRVLSVAVTRSEAFVLRWASNLETPLGVVAPAVVMAALRSGRVFLHWRNDLDETIQEGSLPLIAE